MDSRTDLRPLPPACRPWCQDTASTEGDLTTSSSGSLDSADASSPPGPPAAPDNPWQRRRPRRRRPLRATPPACLAAIDRVAAATDLTAAAALLPPAPALTTRRRLLAGHHLWLNPQYAPLERLLGEGVVPQVWPEGWEDDAPVVCGPWGITALEVGEPRPLAAPRNTRLIRARHAAGEPCLFVALVRGHDPWAMVFWAGSGAVLNPAGCLPPRLRLRLAVRHIWDIALSCERGAEPAELLVFNRHPLGPRRVTRYRLAPP